MTKKTIKVNYPNLNGPFKTKVTCPLCEETVERRSSTQVYCKEQCRARAYAANTRYSITCEVCNTTITTNRKSKKTCSKFCADVMGTTTKQLWTDEELTHLALLNPGVGIRNMMSILHPGNTNNSTRPYERMHMICTAFTEETGLHLLDYLEDPSKMIEIPLDEYIAEHGGRTPKGMGGPGSKLRQHQILDRYNLLKRSGLDTAVVDGRVIRRTTRKVSISPEFKWGPYKPRKYRDSE